MRALMRIPVQRVSELQTDRLPLSINRYRFRLGGHFEVLAVRVLFKGPEFDIVQTNVEIECPFLDRLVVALKLAT